MLATADNPLHPQGTQSAPRPSARTRLLSLLARRFKPAVADERGIALLEVIVAAALVAIISIGTLTGLEGAANSTTDNRLHNQAAVLAAQSQETLRSEPTETLEQLAKETEEKPSKPYTQTKTIENQHFTVTQKIEEVNGATGTTGCTASAKEGESSHAGGYYFRVTTLVTWPQLSSREQVQQTSVITPRTGSVLEVTVDTAAGTPEPVSGATVDAGGLITTTGATGCVIFPAIDATSTSLTVEKSGYVTATGAPKFQASEIAIAPNITTQYQVILSPAGAIKAIFTYKKEAKASIQGDTFIAYNSELASGSVAGGTTSEYATSASTGYTLSPYSTNWTVYAGDCTSDNAETMSSGTVKDGSVKVIGGQTVEVNVPMSHVELNVYEGSSKSSPGSLTKTSYPVKVVDPLCSQATSDEHTQQTTTSGHLTYPYQPFGKFALCLYNASGEKKTYTVPYENKTEAGSTLNVYLAAGSKKGKFKGSETTEEEGVEIKTEQKSC
jgi:type II secretory pathway pseudopilin PulG